MLPFSFEIKLKLSKSFPPGNREIKFGKYLIQELSSSSRGSGEAILKFENRFESPMGGGSNPEGEAEIVCRFLSLIYNVRVAIGSYKINNQNILTREESNSYPQYLGNIETINCTQYLDMLHYLDDDLARQLIRAIHVFSFSLEFIPSDPTFAFFLLVVSVECLSSQVKIIPNTEFDVDKKKCERFCKFIKTNYPKNLKSEDEKNDSLFTELLKTVYYSHRSGFVHGGKEVSAASLMADRLNSSYFKHAINGKETRTPGLGWFAKIVRGSILGFLNKLNRPENINDENLIPRLAFERVVLNIKAKRNISKGQFVKSDDIDFR